MNLACPEAKQIIRPKVPATASWSGCRCVARAGLKIFVIMSEILILGSLKRNTEFLRQKSTKITK